MKHRAAAKGRKLFLLAAACVLASLVVVPAAEASHSLPAALAPVLSPPAPPAQVLEDRPAEPQTRYGLFGDLSLPERPLELVQIEKTASGVSTCKPRLNIRQTGGLSRNCSGPSFQGLWTDPVTGIAYGRNRWYDARTASWLSEDPKGAVDSPNLYAFVGWGPHVGRDPMGSYTQDVHRDLTGYLALRAGFEVDEAREIAEADQAVDEDDRTSPIKNPRRGNWGVVLEFHFPIQPGERQVRRYSPAARQRADNAETLEDLGAGLHTIQDSYSHEESYVGNIVDQSNRYPKNMRIKAVRKYIRNDEEGIGHPDRPEIGCLTDTTTCDDTSVEPDKAMEMARNTYFTLIRYRVRMGDISEQEAAGLKAKWDRMRPIVRKLVEAESEKAKEEWTSRYAYQIRAQEETE